MSAKKKSTIFKKKKDLESKVPESKEKWKILIVDDEEDIHAITRMVLRNATFDGKKMELLSAYSAKEAKEIFRVNPDIALILLDVVMENRHAGLDLIGDVREDLKNSYVTIVIRTGQPGAAPEKEVVENYGINDYRTKSELTKDRLYTLILNGLRSYETAMDIDSHRQILEEKIRERTEKLKSSEEKYRLLAENTSDVIWTLSPEGKFTYVSPSVKNLRGYTPEEVLEQRMDQALTPESLEIVQSEMEEIFAQIQKGATAIEPRIYELEQPCKDGSTVWTEVVVSYLFDDSGDFNGFLGVTRNIADRKKAERELRESEERFRLSFENSNVGMCLVDTDGKFLQVNKEMCKIFGYSKNELERMSVNDITHPDYQEVSPDFIEHAVNGKLSNNSFEKLYFHKNGDLVWGLVSSSLVKDSQGKLLYFISHVQDITAKKQAEKAFKESHKRFKTVMNSLKSLMYVADMETHELLFINKYTKGLFGDIEGKICWKTLQAGKTEPCEFCTNKYLLEDGEPTKGYIWEFQNTVTGKWYHIHDRAICWIDGRLVRLEVATDITELKTAEKALREANATKDKFFSIIAHDLKNPFNSILGLSEILSEEFDLFSEDKLKNMAEQIHNSAGHLYKLLENLLQWSRAQTGRIKYEPKTVDFKLIIDNYRILMKNVAKIKNIDIYSDVPEKTYVYVDWNMVEIVVRNLLSNALKFTPEGGKIRISTTDNGQFIEVWIQDNGVGIREEDIDKLFRIDASFTTKGTANERGTGLGLILCKEFVERHGGNIWVESQEGEGSTFKFTIPKGINPKGENNGE
jgi:PAS domain S-box-containing protein